MFLTIDIKNVSNIVNLLSKMGTRELQNVLLHKAQNPQHLGTCFFTLCFQQHCPRIVANYKMTK